jgi:putative transposase
MSGTVRIRQDHSGNELRRLAARGKDADQSRRLLSPAAVLDGMSRADAARIGGMGLTGRFRPLFATAVCGVSLRR